VITCKNITPYLYLFLSSKEGKISKIIRKIIETAWIFITRKIIGGETNHARDMFKKI